MRRREFIALVAGAAALHDVGAQQRSGMPVIGYLGTTTPQAMGFRIPAFRQGLSETGFVEGKNVAIEYRWAEGKLDRLPALAADLVQQGVSVIVAPGSLPAALAAKAATTTIPVVFETGADPVASGLVSNLQRPGGNVTGVTALTFELVPKRLELMHEIVPKARLIGHLINPTPDAAAGGLAAYGGSIPDSHRLAGVHTARVLKGEKPADLPVQQATKIELFINMKTAKALGVPVPPSVLARADEVIG